MLPFTKGIRVFCWALFVAVGGTGLMADDVLHPLQPVLDRPTLTALGVQLPLTGDDNFNSSVTVRYRKAGTSAWFPGLPLFRVHPESVANWSIAPQFAGSIFDLRPGTSYEIELHATDPDGPVDNTFTLTATTRAVPADPPTPRLRAAHDDASLTAALLAALPGDIITLADGVYTGPISFVGSGTEQNPIVIRGASRDGTVIDGGGCSPCNIWEIYGSYVHLERMTLRNAERAIRFQLPGAQGNVVRRVHISNTRLGIGARLDQLDFYICDNVAEGRLSWPQVYSDDHGSHANDDGIAVAGFGHVVCHNQISGFGDAMKTQQDGARAVDFYGNDILFTYDNGIELDGSEGNSRCLRNRFTNAWDTLSVQPIYGGPAYLLRNVVVNAADEQMKFHALGLQPPPEPNGVLAYHNTFVSTANDLHMNTPNASHHFAIENNLFIGPSILPDKAVKWDGPIDDGLFDYNGYFPDGPMTFNFVGTGYRNWPNFAAVQAGGLETHGLVLAGRPFATPIALPPTYQTLMAPMDVALAPASSALDRGVKLANINDAYTGTAPDLGAQELGCPAPIYGPRPEGIDETNEPLGCAASIPATGRIQVCVSGVATAFTFNVGGTTVVVPGGSCNSPLTMPVGSVAIAQSQVAGTSLTGIATLPAGLLVSSNLSAGTATVTVASGTQTVVTFTNAPPNPGLVQICTVAGNGIAPGTPFTFNVEGTTITVPSGSCGPPKSVLAGSAIIAQTLPTGISLTGVATMPSAALLSSASLASGNAIVTILPGAQTTTTFTNALASPVPTDAFQVYCQSNLNIGDSTVNLTNTGTVGDICVNVYAFDPSESLVSCCSCLVTPNALNSLSARDDLISNTITASAPSSIVVKLLASLPSNGASCNAASPASANLAPGLRAWGTSLHALPPSPSGAYGVTESPFKQATLSAAELTRITNLCAFFQSNGSGFGICKSCRLGGLGGLNQ